MSENDWHPADNPKHRQAASAVAWCVILGVLFALCLILEISEVPRFLQTHLQGPVGRILYDLVFYFVAGGFGIAVAHLQIKRSMAITNARLQGVVARSLQELKRMLPPELRKKEEAGKEAESETSSSTSRADSTPNQDSSVKEIPRQDPIPLPIPYIVAKLADMRPDSFGYFGGKLLARDPRLLLNLSLDAALERDQSEAIWEMKQWIVEANKETAKPPTNSHTQNRAGETPQQETAETKPLDKTPEAGEPDPAKKTDQTLVESIDALLKAVPHLLTVLKILQRQKRANEAVGSETGPSTPPKSEEEER
jgi:hypothetical protein